jgi:hypothetical protein
MPGSIGPDGQVIRRSVIFPVRVAAEQLASVCRDNNVAAEAIPGTRTETTGERKAMTSSNWEDVCLRDHGFGGPVVAQPIPRSSSNVYWRDLLFSRKDMLKAFPETLHDIQASEGSSNSASSLHARILSDVTSDAPVPVALTSNRPATDQERPTRLDQPSTTGRKRIVADLGKSDDLPNGAPVRIAIKRETEAVYRDWIAQHEGQMPPSRDEDWNHMKRHFPKIPRDRVRELRNELAPKAWLQQGRRKKTGGRKPAK